MGKFAIHTAGWKSHSYDLSPLWMRPTHIIEDNLLYLNSTDGGISCGPVARMALPLQGSWVRPLVGEPRSHMLII